MARILINDTFKKFLLSQPPALRSKIRKQFEFLEIGSWDGGLRVKKIKGSYSNRTVFEARLDKSSRILFTLGSADASASARENNLLIYVWGIIAHDDISLKSRNIIPQNVPFLNFTPFDELDLPEVFFEELDQSCFTEENISRKISGDSGTQKWYPVYEAEWQRIQLYSKNDFELFLYLTPEQEEIVSNAVPPLLISGTAGSGKTTIGVYFLLKPSLSGLNKLFITYNKFLKNSAERLFNSLLNSNRSSARPLQPDFFTYKELCLKITSEAGRHFTPDLEVDFDKFSSMLSSSGRNTSRFDIPLIWEEIRSIIKGALPQLNVKLFETAHHKIKSGMSSGALFTALQGQFNIFSNLESVNTIDHIVQRFMRMDIRTLIKNLNYPSDINFERLLVVIENIIELFSRQRDLGRKKYLSFLEYEIMGKKKAPNFIYDRKEIYRIFEWYQDKLESARLWDELDLSRETIKVLNENDDPKFLYDLAVCDEVQDLTDVQHELLFYLTKNPMNLVLTGDSKQIINPSGFRWEELKRHFFDRNIKVPEIRSLSLNFRSSGSIVDLSNCLTDIKNRLLGFRSDQPKEDWKYKSRPPVIVTGINEPDLIQNLLMTSAGKTILVRNQEEKSLLKQSLGTEMIFTIYEAKGLEFDTVLLWKFCSDKSAVDLWKNILEDEHVSFHSAKIRHEINLLYVAVTRAQKDLLIYDGGLPSVIWNNPQFSDKVFISGDISYLNNIWNVISTPEEWLQQGNYFFEREYFSAAIECFKNAGALDELSRAQAFFNEKKGSFLDAAHFFEKSGDYQRAALNYEKASAFPDALRLWSLLKNNEKISEYRIKVLELEGRWSELAEIFLKEKQYRKAADNFLKAKDYLNAALILSSKLKDFDKAAGCFEASGQPLKAAPLFAKTKNYAKAAQLFEKAHDYENAIKYWQKAGNGSKVLNLLNLTGNFTELIKYYEKNKDIASAVRLLKKHYSPEVLLDQARLLFEKKKYFGAYLRYLAAENNEGIANSCFQLRMYNEAGKYYESSKNLFSAGMAYEKAKSYEKAFLCFLKTEDEKQSDFPKARHIADFLPYHKVSEIGQSFYREGEFELALRCCLVGSDYVNAGLCNLKMKKFDDAVDNWSCCLVDDFFETVADCCLTNSKVELLARVIFNSGTRRFKEDWRRPFLKEKSSSVVLAMDKYFAQNPSLYDEMLLWAQRLMLLDSKYNYVSSVISYFEKSGRYSTYFISMKDAEYDHYLYKYYAEIKKYLKNNSSTYEKTGESLAVALQIIDPEKFSRALETISYNENNAILFLYSKSSQELKDKAFDYLVNNYDHEMIWKLLIDAREFLMLARYFESQDNLTDAAHYYNVAGELEKSIRLWIEAKQFHKAGDIYYSIGNYSMALEMYEKTGKAKMKIADSLLKLGRYDEAIEIYQKAGKHKLLQKAQLLKLKASGIFLKT